MGRVLITGATGFIGRHLCRYLAQRNFEVVAVGREMTRFQPSAGIFPYSVGEIDARTDWESALKGVSVVVHLAARVHVMRETAADPTAEFRRVNVSGTEKLLSSAIQNGVRKFVYLSTVKVLGEKTEAVAFSSESVCDPKDPYARSKQEAEHLIGVHGARGDIETSIIRPPLVYGPGVGGNLLRLMRLVDRLVPLPFGRIDNQRSLVAIENLCSLTAECIENTAAADQIFLVSDDEDVSTRDLIRMLGEALSRRARLVPVPVFLLKLAAAAAGQKDAASRLTESLQVDISDTRRRLGWRPPISVREGIQATADWYVESTRG